MTATCSSTLVDGITVSLIIMIMDFYKFNTIELKKAILKDLETKNVSEIVEDFKQFAELVTVDYVIGTRVSKHNRIIRTSTGSA